MRGLAPNWMHVGFGPEADIPRFSRAISGPAWEMQLRFLSHTAAGPEGRPISQLLGVTDKAVGSNLEVRIGVRKRMRRRRFSDRIVSRSIS